MIAMIVAGFQVTTTFVIEMIVAGFQVTMTFVIAMIVAEFQLTTIVKDRIRIWDRVWCCFIFAGQFLKEIMENLLFNFLFSWLIGKAFLSKRSKTNLI